MFAVQVFPVRAAVILALSFLAYAEVPQAGGMRELNNEVLRRHGVRPEGDGGQGSEPAIERRAAALRALISEDPATAVTFAFPAGLLAELAQRFPASAARLEEQGAWEGTLETFVLDRPGGKHETRHVLRRAGGDLELYFSGPEPAGARCGLMFSVQGVRMEGKVAVATASTTTATASPTGCSASGDQKTVVLLVTFPGVTPPAGITAPFIQDAFFGATGRSLDNYWREASYGKTSASGAVFGWYTLPSAYTCTTTDALRDAAITMATNAGVNFQNYTRIFLVVPDMGCGWSGAATLGCTTLFSPTGSFAATTSYLNWSALTTRDDTVALAAHEGGHNLGLAHANSRAFGTEALGAPSAPGTEQVYGDGFSAMSNGGLGHYAASQKAEILNWLGASNYQTVQGNGTWTLQPLESPTSGLQALKIQRGTGGSSYLWVEYRQPIGNYDNSYYLAPDMAQWYSWANQVFTGALIHYWDSTTGVQSQLLDFTPTSSNGFYDAALAAGQSWKDPYTDLSITVQSATASGLTLAVSYGGAVNTCVRANPAVTLAPVSPSVYSGSSVGYTLSLTNQDSAACPASSYALGTSQPSGWLGQLSASSLSLAPGSTGTATLTEAVPAGTAPGTYALSASAASGTYTSTAQANASVVTAPTLTATTSVAAASYTVRQTLTVNTTVMYGTTVAAGASVTFKLTRADGSKVTGTATADSLGKATWSYRISNKDAKGSATVNSTATYQSQTATSNTASFLIQ